MNPIYVSAFVALAGSVVGSGTSLLTAWFTQHRQDRQRRLSKDRGRRRKLYREFIHEASKLYADALVHDQVEVSSLVHIYALIGRMRIQSGAAVIEKADQIVQIILDTYATPNKTFAELRPLMGSPVIDPLRRFSEECRIELSQAGLP